MPSRRFGFPNLLRDSGARFRSFTGIRQHFEFIGHFTYSHVNHTRGPSCPSLITHLTAVTDIEAVSMLAARSPGESLSRAMGLFEENPGLAQRHNQMADIATVAVFALLPSRGLAVGHPRNHRNAPPFTVILVGHAGAQLACAGFPNT